MVRDSDAETNKKQLASHRYLNAPGSQASCTHPIELRHCIDRVFLWTGAMTDRLTETRDELDAAFSAFHAQRDLSVIRYQTCAEVERIYHKAAKHLEREILEMPHAARLKCDAEQWVVHVIFDRLRIEAHHLLRCVDGDHIDENEALGIGKIPPTREEIVERQKELREKKSVSNKFDRHAHADGLHVISLEEMKWCLR